MTKYPRGVPSHSKAQHLANAISVSNLYGLLSRAIREPAVAPDELRAAWACQGTLARLQMPSLGIAPMALNTLKAHAEAVVEGGWVALDKVRKQAKAAYEAHLRKEKAPSRGSRADLQKRLSDEKYAVQTHIDSIAEISMMYFDLLSIMRRYSDKDDSMRTALDLHLRRFGRSKPKLHVIPGGKDG